MEAVEDVASLGDVGDEMLEGGPSPASASAVGRGLGSRGGGRGGGAGPGPGAFLGLAVTRATTAAACGALADLFLGALGPGGRHPLVQRNAASRAVVATTCSSRVADAVRVDHPVARVVLEAVRGHQRRWGDAGLLSAFLATRLVQRTLEAEAGLGLSSGAGLALRRHLEAMGRARAAAVAETALGDPSRGLALRMAVASAAPLLALIRGVVAPKARVCGLSAPGGVDALAAAIAEAFVASAAAPDGQGGGQAEATGAVGTCAYVAASWDCTDGGGGFGVRRGVAVRCFEPPGAEFPDLVEGPRLAVALFTAGLDVDELHLEAAALSVEDGDRLVRVGDAAGALSAAEAVAAARAPPGPSSKQRAEGAAFVALADALAAAGVRVVACQRTMATTLQALLIDRGILPVPRLSAKHVQRIAAATGAVPLTTAAAAVAVGGDSRRLRDALGECAGIRRLSLGGRPHLILEAEECDPDVGEACTAGRRPVCTLLLPAVDQHAADELEAIAEAALRVLGLALRPGAVVLPGGGCAEAWLARAFRDTAEAAARAPGLSRTESALVAQGAVLVASCLEEACCALATHLAPEALLESLRPTTGRATYVGVVHGGGNRMEGADPSATGPGPRLGSRARLGPVASRLSIPAHTVGACHLLDLGEAKLEGVRCALDAASLALRVATVSRH